MISQYARTLTQITDDTMRLCRDFRGSANDGKIWTWAEVLHQVKKAFRDLVVSTGILKGIRSIIIQQGVYVYDLPPDCIRLLRASVNGLEGHAILPKSRGAFDYEKSDFPSTQGDPLYFFRDILPPGKIGFVPGPDVSGSTFERDSLLGLLRSIAEGDDYLSYDSESALRSIENLDVRMITTGDGGIIRDIINPYGNIQVTYVRMPILPDEPDNYPDPEIPEYIHKDIKYGASLPLLRALTTPEATSKRQWFEQKWYSVMTGLQTYAEHKGVLGHARPV